MKLNQSMLWATVGLLAVLTVPLAAQTIHLKAEIPFEFNVNGQLLPAGTYYIEQRSSASTRPDVMAVVDQDRTNKMVFLVLPLTADRFPEQAKLVFTRVHDLYFLSEIWTTVSTEGLKLLKSRQERELIARAPLVQKQDVVILARR